MPPLKLCPLPAVVNHPQMVRRLPRSANFRDRTGKTVNGCLVVGLAGVIRRAVPLPLGHHVRGEVRGVQPASRRLRVSQRLAPLDQSTVEDMKPTKLRRVLVAACRLFSGLVMVQDDDRGIEWPISFPPEPFSKLRKGQSMSLAKRFTTVVGIVAYLLSSAALSADELDTADGLQAFKSQEGTFSVRLPGRPKYEKTTVGEAREVQHQFTLGMSEGVYLISYQDNPNLREATPDALLAALESARDRLKESFRGKLVESEKTKLQKKHPGLAFRLTIPAANGEARCRYYLVATRLYQVMALGTPSFVMSEEATRVLDSFTLLP